MIHMNSVIRNEMAGANGACVKETRTPLAYSPGRRSARDAQAFAAILAVLLFIGAQCLAYSQPAAPAKSKPGAMNHPTAATAAKAPAAGKAAGAVQAPDAAATPTLSAGARIGVYDSRAVAVAYAGSALFNKKMQPKYDAMKKAKESGDAKRINELKAEFSAHQKLFHTQGFSTAPVDDILETIKDQLPDIQKKAGVSALISKWDEKALAAHPGGEHVDVTSALVDAFQPNARQRKYAVEIQKSKPIPLKDAENIKD